MEDDQTDLFELRDKARLERLLWRGLMEINALDQRESLAVDQSPKLLDQGLCLGEKGRGGVEVVGGRRVRAEGRARSDREREGEKERRRVIDESRERDE
jgi:hypothetical protein